MSSWGAVGSNEAKNEVAWASCRLICLKIQGFLHSDLILKLRELRSTSRAKIMTDNLFSPQRRGYPTDSAKETGGESRKIGEAFVLFDRRFRYHGKSTLDEYSY